MIVLLYLFNPVVTALPDTQQPSALKQCSASTVSDTIGAMLSFAWLAGGLSFRPLWGSASEKLPTKEVDADIRRLFKASPPEPPFPVHWFVK